MGDEGALAEGFTGGEHRAGGGSCEDGRGVSGWGCDERALCELDCWLTIWVWGRCGFGGVDEDPVCDAPVLC